MYYLRNVKTGQFISSMMKRRNGRYIMYFADKAQNCCDARWRTLKGAEAARQRLAASGTVESIYEYEVVWEE